MSHKDAQKYRPLDEAEEALVYSAIPPMPLSARAHDEILKVARTMPIPLISD